MASGEDFAGRVLGAASQGAVGAVVAASLSAFTEPIVNNVLVNRVPLGTAIKELDMNKVRSFLKTTLSTNFIKFPFFEATNVVMSGVELSGTARGALTGSIFCTTTLPITNYRFRKSMGLPITASNLYQAYLPTVLRDIIYGIVRNKVMTYMVGLSPERAGTNMGRFTNMFITVVFASFASAPGNELRGYTLQPPSKALLFKDFFKPEKFIRSTTVGALIMAISLGVGTLATPQVERLAATLKAYFQSNPIGILLVVLFALNNVLVARRQAQLVETLEARPALKC